MAVVALPYQSEKNPEICRLLSMVHRAAVRGFVPGFHGGITVELPLFDGHGGKMKCDLRQSEQEDLTHLWKSGKQ